MIEILQKSEDDYELVIDNKVSEFANVGDETDRESKEKYFTLLINDLDFLNQIKRYSLKDFPSISFMSFSIELPWFNNGFNPDIQITGDDRSGTNSNKSFKLALGFTESLANWRGNYTLTNYYEELKKLVAKHNSNNLYVNDEYGLEGLSIDSKEGLSPILSLTDQIYEFLGKIKFLHIEIEKNINNSLFIENINLSFNFPNEIAIFCEQYLLYFAQFLKDLGINATSNLKEEAGKVLFSVTPTDNVEALDKIREALAVYLNLPASPISDLEYSENFALMRLQQQVRNLQHSQQMAKTELLSAQYALGLAQSNIENQDQIIVRQHSTIENLNKVIEKITSSSIMTDSLDEKDKEKFEEICEGLRVGESKWLRELTGVGLSTGKFVKAIVKHTFGKEEKNSILGLDEE